VAPLEVRIPPQRAETAAGRVHQHAVDLPGKALGARVVLANMATLMGLLGTIIGLIDAFTAVSNANPAEKAELLSASISIGMNCTAFGLMVAIPLVLIHSLLQTKTTEIVDSLEMASVKFLNAITERAQDGKPVEAPVAPAPAPRRA
jgi:biopolymer transport protein ExbB/TolQ